MPGTVVRNDQAEINISVAKKNKGSIDLGPMATYSGGELSSNSTKTRAGGMGQEFDVGGQGTRTDAQLTIEWSADVLAKLNDLESRVGKGLTTITIQWLDREGDALTGSGAVDTGLGILKGVSRPAYDHMGNAVGFMTLVVGMHEQAA